MADRFTPVGPPSDDETSEPGAKLVWFVVIALASMISVAVVAYVLKAMLFIG